MTEPCVVDIHHQQSRLKARSPCAARCCRGPRAASAVSGSGEEASAAPPTTSESARRTWPSPCTMSTRVCGAEGALSQSTGITVQRMRVACSETLSAIAVRELERRAPGFFTWKVVFMHKLHSKVTKRHPHVENFSTRDSTLKSRRRNEGPPCSSAGRY